MKVNFSTDIKNDRGTLVFLCLKNKPLDKYLNNDINIQSIHDTFSENTLSNFYFPFSVAPNFLINNKNYCLPMVIEESSVVAAACNSAKFWYDKGGFRAEVISSEKIGQIQNGRTGKCWRWRSMSSD